MVATHDDALRWDGDEPETPEARPTVAPESTEGITEVAPTSSILLVTYGILAGAYALYTVGWFIASTRNSIDLPTVLGDFMFGFGESLAIAAPLVWFGATLLLTRRSRPLVRLVWLLVGLAVLVPLPFVLGGSA